MTAPRPVIAGRTYLVSRRCTQRQFLLRPDEHVSAVYLYCLAEAAQRFEITVHGCTAMSNHQHCIVRDNLGNLPEFLAHLHKMIAKALNAYWDRSENFWSSEQPNVVHLVGPEDRFDKLVYVLANPVADHLVERVSDWPGASSYRWHLNGKALTVKRPRGFFREDGPMPEEVTLGLERLEGFEDLSDDEWSARIDLAVRDSEAKASAARRENHLRVFGRKNVLRAPHTHTAMTEEARGAIRPSVACRDVGARVAALEALRSFRDAYRGARLRWCAGDRRVVFPPGTYQLRAFGVRCQPDEPCDSAA